MPNWTKEQLQAINQEGSNLIVSAGAGSGKTAVLTARVIRKLKSGIHIDELLILTFTKAAAKEMKERIRKAILEEDSLREELERLDSSYITTFDSYVLSVLKKYHYLRNLPKNIKITESSLVELEKAKTVDRIFDFYYEKQDPIFEKMIEHFCLKDDKSFRQNLYRVYQKLENIYNLEEFLLNYDSRYQTTGKREKVKHSFLSFLKEKRNELEDMVTHFPSDDGDFLGKPFLEAETYEAMYQAKEMKLPNLPRNSEEETKEAKENLSNLWKEILSYFPYRTLEEWEENEEKIQDEISLLVHMLQEIHRQITSWKKEHHYFEFQDVAFEVISLLEENDLVRTTIRDHFQEILLDEYQDTNDIQEHFISLISHHNVYMVGDIKQSIYRFRNANPYLFKAKYDAYRLGQDGSKIDLDRNFRSRKETLDDINLIFDSLMDDELGDASYRKEHRMVFGNETYEKEGKNGEDHHMELWNYPLDQKTVFSKEEIEAFLIAEDIKKKVEEHYPIFDVKKGTFHEAKFSDFAILLDRSTSFELYKKIFVYLNIPLSLWKDEIITGGMDLFVLRNLFKFILKIRKKEFDSEFRYAFTSVSRSFLCKLSDEEISDCFLNDSFTSTELYQKCEKISCNLSSLSCELLLTEILEEFSYYEKLITIGDVEDGLLRLEYLHNLASSMDETGYLVEEFVDFLDDLIEEGILLRYQLPKVEGDSVKLMTIHKSKGLEFPICYYAGLSSKFNIQDMKETILFDKEYGILLPFTLDGELRHSMEYYLLKNRYLREEISEKMRLFYVAMTRAKEKMIFISPWKEKNSFFEQGMIPLRKRQLARSFLDFLEASSSVLTPYRKEKWPSHLSKEYLSKTTSVEVITKMGDSLLEVEELEENTEITNEVRFSKQVSSLLNKEEEAKMKLGKELHAVLETIDFLRPDVSDYGLDPYYEAKIKSFFRQDFMQDLEHSKWYRELEFYDGHRHGIIDLVIEREDKLILVDYKLKHTNDPHYLEQLEGYLIYLKKKSTKPIEVYLYSILEEKSIPLTLELNGVLS